MLSLPLLCASLFIRSPHSVPARSFVELVRPLASLSTNVAADHLHTLVPSAVHRAFCVSCCLAWLTRPTFLSCIVQPINTEPTPIVARTNLYSNTYQLGMNTLIQRGNAGLSYPLSWCFVLLRFCPSGSGFWLLCSHSWKIIHECDCLGFVLPVSSEASPAIRVVS